MTLRTLIGSIIALALVAAAPARAGGFSTTNVQLLQGYDFGDPPDFPSFDGTKTTLTINHFSTWEYGDSFFFTDLARGKAADETDVIDAYVEWHPRLFVNQLLGQKDPLFGLIRNWGLAGEINQGSGFYAYLGGLGLDFAAPAGWVLGLNLFYRYDNFNYHVWQVSPYWTVPFSLGPVPFLFQGFVDVNGLDDQVDTGYEVWAQPQLLVDVLGMAGGPKGKLLAGAEWYYHSKKIGDYDEAVSVPQVMVQWTVF